MFVKQSNKAEKEMIPAGKGSFKQVLIGSDLGPNFSLRRFIIEPGGFIPMHTNTVEHEQYILNGKAEISLDGKIYNVTKDDVIFMPSGAPHYYKNTGNEPFEFLCIVPNKEDILKFVDNKKAD